VRRSRRDRTRPTAAGRARRALLISAAAPWTARTCAGLASLINLFNPERIIIGGWAGILLCAELLPELRAATAEHALRQPFAPTSIELCTLGEHALTLGAATLPVEEIMSTTRRPEPTPALRPQQRDVTH
jgi:predicted NBD/HSP70 family sugar kinase